MKEFFFIKFVKERILLKMCFTFENYSDLKSKTKNKFCN